MPRWKWLLSQLTRQLWFRATMIGMIGILAAILAAVAERFIPWSIPGGIRADAVDDILNILASSMLAVTTFSLGAMTSAYGSATSNVTPRATALLVQDRVTQNVLSTFLGSFLYSIVGIVVLKTGAYGDSGRVILFVVTVGVIVLIVVSLLRWIDHLTKLGRVGETTTRVETATRRAIQDRLQHPYLNGTPLLDPERDIPDGATPVRAGAIGYVQHIDISALAQCCKLYDADLYLAVNPGAFVYTDTPLAWWGRPTKAEDGREPSQAVRDAVSIGLNRSFDQDPRFGLVVMSEIASRALSPAVNDPGTAIDVIGRNTRLLNLWAEAPDEEEIEFPRVHVPPLSTVDLFEDAFMAIARDGASYVEVQLRLQKCLRALANSGNDAFRNSAHEQARIALVRAEAALPTEIDRRRLLGDI
ncbi:DUF2254 domain-containing protein [Ciceribacter sp. L1K23]|uniref:DUF2254 domain-containing protein n=1 Tax=Ciceribacter sp. L1K23 TaxID=2820276 RepID=UPI001B844BA6|nr:DUF2254 domain-containing protein [Ciceribacter sp. L1K23]MBR0555562.1 DUF2254 domain-containing protein [Ciceribacter sp. L1K23]